MHTKTFNINSQAIAAIIVSDPNMRHLVELIGDYTLHLRTDYFASLVRSIIGQQLSIKPAQIIWQRLKDGCGCVSPDNILKLDNETFKSMGLSRPKANYLRDLSQKVMSGEVVLEDLACKSDQAVIDDLIRIKGIGRWTAQMFLIFSLGRPDVFAEDDVALKRAIMWLYSLEDNPGKEELLEISDKWCPHRSVASLYLWEAINRGYL